MRHSRPVREQRDPRLTPPRHRRTRPGEDTVGTEQIEVIRFDWQTTAGIQPVILVTRRRLD
jgi:hypothetical protein